MLNHMVTNKISADSTCIVCNQPLVYGEGLPGEQVCKSYDCIRLVKQKSSLPPMLYANIFRIQSKIIRDRHKHAKQEEERKRAIDQLIKQDDQKLAMSIKQQNEHARLFEQEGELVSIASGGPKLTNLTDRRKRKFRDHLTSKLAEANSNLELWEGYLVKNRARLEKHDDQFDKLSGLEDQVGRVCAHCRGGCCGAGHDTGFVDALLLRRVMKDKPEMRPREIYQTYMDCLPHKSIDGSCLFHTNLGCNLPRLLRSEVCNSYLCESVVDYMKKSVEEQQVKPAIVVSRNYRQFHRYDDGANLDVLRACTIVDKTVDLIDVINLD